jgi:ribosome biogenesis ATPase
MIVENGVGSDDPIDVDVDTLELGTTNSDKPTQVSLLDPSSSIAQFLVAHPSPLTPTQLEPLHITFDDFLAALPTVQPSSKREGFATIPDVTWADVGALHAIRDELHMSIVQPILRPELFKSVGIDAPSGVLLWGPPGCGKTLLAKAVANESRANFISVKGPELLNKVRYTTRYISNTSSLYSSSTSARASVRSDRCFQEHEPRLLVSYSLTNSMRLYLEEMTL